MTAGSSTSDLVERVLGQMRDAADGDSSKIEDLVAAEAKKGVTTPAGPAGLSIEERKVQRPNGDWYHVRKVGIHDDIALIRRSRERDMPVILVGPPGTGKTALLEAAFAKAGARGFFTVNGHADTEAQDFLGGYVQLPDGNYVWEDGPLIKAMEQGLPVYIDEVALIDPRVMALAYGAMDGRREINVTLNPTRGTVVAKDGFYVCASTNPNAPGARMGEALVSRFIIQIEVNTDWALARKLGVEPKAVTAAQNIAKKQSSGETAWAPQLRELLAHRDVTREFGLDLALANLVQCAPENDRPVVADCLSRSYGQTITALTMS